MSIRTRLTIQGATLKGRWGPRLTVAAQIDGQHVVHAAHEECRAREHRLARVITTGSDDHGTAAAEETTGMSRGCRSAVA